MHKPPYYVVGNVTRVYSPVTLSNEWPTLGRLLFMVFLSCLGSILNGFFVSAFFVERTLKRIGESKIMSPWNYICSHIILNILHIWIFPLPGNVFLACVGLSDLILTAGVMPVSAVVLLSGEWDILPVCRALQFLTESSTYGYSLFFTVSTY